MVDVTPARIGLLIDYLDRDGPTQHLLRRDWLTMPEDGMGIVVHDVHRERDY